MIPDENIAAVTQALREACDITEFEAIEQLTKGHTSSLVFRIVVRGTPYLLKIIVRPDDPTRHYANMKRAAEAGLAPRVLYTNIKDKICITDFVETESFSVSDALLRLPALLRTLHALPRFDRVPWNTSCTFLINKGPALDGFLDRFRASSVLREQDGEEFFARHAELLAAYPHDDEEMVSSHNDLFKPDNILFDGRQVWLVDWEASFLNDRYADLAVTANHVVTNEAEELAYLREYFGTAPDVYQRARFHLMQQLAHLFYTMAFLFHDSSGKPIDWNASVPELSDFHRSMWAGEVDLANKDVRVVYGRAHWARLQHNVRQPRYQEALKIVAGRHAIA